MWIDSHAHLADKAFVGSIDEVMRRVQEASVEQIVNICTDRDSLNRGLALAEEFPILVNAAATPPHTVLEEGELDFPSMADAARTGRLVAVGETGLDYHYEHSPRDIQKAYLRSYLALAREVDLPVVIHCRDAFEDFFSILDEEFSDIRGVLHCFTGTLEEARGVIERGWYLSLSGIVTFKRSEALREVAAWVPLEQLLIETDSPYLAPQSRRGKRNEPANVVEVGESIAQVKNLPPSEVALATRHNARTLFRL